MTNADRYGTVAITLHWLIALLILTAFVLGLTVDSFPKPWTGTIINLHSLIGLTILLLTFVRLFWRLGHPAPPLPEAFGQLAKFAASAVHVALYILMIATPIIGVPTLLYRGRGLDFGFLQITSPFARTPEIYRPLTQIHEIAAYALIGLAVGHALAALYHQFALRDGVLTRMLPAPKR